MSSVFSDPKLFNYVLIALHGAAAVRHACALHWWDSGYWLLAFLITCLMTWRPA
jgi:hypothetical protein